MAPFEFTERLALASNKLWAITAAVGAGLCFLVLLIIAVVALHPISRPKLDRVSFRIVTYALAANMIYGISSSVGGMLTGPSWGCGFAMFALQFTLQLSSFLLFSIALNLQLVVVNNCNGLTLEKYYVIGALVLSLCITIPPYAYKQYGWDPLEQDCWYASGNERERLAWQIGTQWLWTAFVVAGEGLCSAIVIMFTMQHNWRRRRRYAGASSYHKRYPRGQGSYRSQGITRTVREPPLDAEDVNSAPHVVHAATSRRIIFRIALYPIASCCINLLSIVTELYLTITHGVHTRKDYNILLLSDFLYGGRSTVYALLALSDPALMRGIKVLYCWIRYGTVDDSKPARVSHGERSAESGQDATFATISIKTDTVISFQMTNVRDENAREEEAQAKADLALALAASKNGLSSFGTPMPSNRGLTTISEEPDNDHFNGVREVDDDDLSMHSQSGLARRWSWRLPRREEDDFKRQI